MSPPKYRGSRDRNHADLVRCLEELGCTVADMALAGVEGFPDVVIGLCGETHLVEFKNPATRYGRAGLNLEQSGFARDWRGSKVWVVSSRDEVIALVTNLRRMARHTRA